MREEDTDWFKRMSARARATAAHDLVFALVVLVVFGVICGAGYWCMIR